MATAFPSIAIDQSSTRTTTRDMITVQMGGGYESTMPNGINYMRDFWNVVFTGLNTTERDTILTFTQAISDGSIATWQTPFDSVVKKFRLNGDVTVSDNGGVVYTVTFPLKQVFDNA